MLKEKLNLKLLILTSLFATNTFASQTIQIETAFTTIEKHPIISFIVNDEDAGTVLPYLLNISQKTSFQEIRLSGNHYKIMGFTIQYNGGSYTNFCDLGQQIDNQATMIKIYGSIGENNQAPECSVNYTAIIPVQHVTATAQENTKTNSKTAATKTNAETKTQQGYKEVGRYLSALKNNCKVSRYAANIDNKTVMYDIRGANNAVCEVDIGVANGQPIRCLLSPEDIAVIASDDQITALNNGKPSTSKVATNVMAKRCHALS